MPNKKKWGLGELICRVSMVVLNILVWFGILIFLYSAVGKPLKGEPRVGHYSVGNLSEGWELSGLKNGEKRTVTLPANIERDTLEGRSLSINRALPEDLTDGMNILVRSIMQDITVYIDGEERGSYRTDNFVVMAEYLPSAFIEIPVSEEDSGKTITVVITPKKHSAVALENITYGSGWNPWYTVLRNSFGPIVIAVILIIFGSASVITCLLIRDGFQGRQNVFYLARIMLIAGLWILGESEIRQLFLAAPVLNTLYSFIFIETVTAFGAMYFNSTQNYEHNKIYSVLISLIAFQCTLNLILQFAGIADLYETLIFSQALSIATLVATGYCIVVDIKNKHIR
ncbi:MAG: hypothetical protein V3G41_02115, partial [Lachnospiraceae bacterium]